MTRTSSLGQSPLVGRMPSTPGAAPSTFSRGSGWQRRTTLPPLQPDGFYAPLYRLRSEDQGHGRWVTVYGFPQASASYILHHFAQYGNILKHVMSTTGNWMHICYQTTLQARKALSSDGRYFGNCFRIGVEPCRDIWLKGSPVEPSVLLGSASAQGCVAVPDGKGNRKRGDT
ncbi:PREDICTED: nucleoporin NUP53-like [Calidris pugnax]|uniref:nucleoporin NUP53-like n=1 Tax=Calidris pugnax TaxID=198806 RepID=UPI00071DD9A5|nr:PREDICTED: nucleoporin NUP53-like [Calidris pugnax]